MSARRTIAPRPLPLNNTHTTYSSSSLRQ